MKNFYLRNYKIIHHLTTLSIFVFFLYMAGHVEIFTSIAFQILILACNYFIVNFCLKQSGIDDEVAKQLKNIQNKKESK
jgi:hypothetical protein